MMSLPVWLPGSMFLLVRPLSLVPCSFQVESVQGVVPVQGSLAIGSLCSGGVSVQGVSVWGASLFRWSLCPWGSLSRGLSVKGSGHRGSLFRWGLCPWGSLSGDLCPRESLLRGLWPEGISVQVGSLSGGLSVRGVSVQVGSLSMWGLCPGGCLCCVSGSCIHVNKSSFNPMSVILFTCSTLGSPSPLWSQVHLLSGPVHEQPPCNCCHPTGKVSSVFLLTVATQIRNIVGDITMAASWIVLIPSSRFLAGSLGGSISSIVFIAGELSHRTDRVPTAHWISVSVTYSAIL